MHCEIAGRPVSGRREDAPPRPLTPSVESLTHPPRALVESSFRRGGDATDRMDSFKQFHILNICARIGEVNNSEILDVCHFDL